MGTIASAFNIATGALDADQSALDIVANNTANANTPGYTVELPLWQQNDSVTLNGIEYGMGASLTGAQSQRSLVLDQAVQQQTQTASAGSARLTAFNQMQALFSGATSAGTDTSETSGIGSDMSSFFDALSSLEASPADVSLREQVLSAAGTLASDFNSAAGQLESQRESLDQQATSVVGQANTLLTDVAQLNVQIASSNPNSDAGTLEDQRQQDLTQLSQLIGIRTVTTEHNGLTVTTQGGALLVSEGQAYPITNGESGGVTDFYDQQGTDVTSDMTSGGGELGGILTARDQDIPSLEKSVDQLAYSLATQLNTANQAGADLDGSAGLPIFSLPSGVTEADPAGSAGGISLIMSNACGIAAAAEGAGSSDNTNVTAMADLQNAAIVEGSTPTAYYSNFVTTLGSQVSEVSSENTAQQASLTQLQSQIGSLSGVSLNDAASQLETLEQAYQAASKVFTVLDQVMVSALNLGVETSYS